MSSSSYPTSFTAIYFVLLVSIVSSEDRPVKDTKGDGCGDWLNLTDVHSAGGTRLSQFYTVELCLHACRDLLDNCVGVDIDSRPHDEIRCWIHSNFEDFAETYRAVGLTQYRLVMPCVQPTCDITGARWRFHANHNSFHGVVPPKPVGSRWLMMWSLDECLEVCVTDLRCLAVDFDMHTRTCYVHHNPNYSDTRGPYPHVHQFVITERCRPGDLMSVKRTTATRPTLSSTRDTSTTLTTTTTPATTTRTTTATTTRPTTTTTTTTTTIESTTSVPSMTTTTVTPVAIVERTSTRATAPTNTTTVTSTTTTTSRATTTRTPRRMTPKPTINPHQHGCETGWVLHAHTHSPGAIRHTAPSTDQPLSLHNCLEHCHALTGSLLAGACLAVDVEFPTGNSSSSVVCWLHTDMSRLSQKYSHPRVMQYIIVRCPQQQEVYTCYQGNDDVIATGQVASAGHTCRQTCMPVWLHHPRWLSVTSAAEADTPACLEQCLRTSDCIGVDVTRHDNNDDDDDDDVMTSFCRYHHSHQAMTSLQRHTSRYQLLDRCYTGCETVWTKQKYIRYRLQHFIKQYNSSALLCAASCRLQPNCSLYELAVSGDNVTCTMAAVYDEASYNVVGHVTSFTRKEHTCRLGAYRCEPSWLLQRDISPVDDHPRRNCSRLVSTVAECLDACLMTSFRCAGATTSPVVDDVIECRLYAHEDQLRPSRDLTGTDLYVLHSHCYSVGRAGNMQGPSSVVLRKDQQHGSDDDESLITRRYTPSSQLPSAATTRPTRPTPSTSPQQTNSLSNDHLNNFY